ncbi:MAG: type II CRISPR RNA-guided endonuclease Cas9, partial [Mycoplasma sp.]|nr:type II CRISPR RNA-guided endonuclease Cas9 [Mycoplasma sp.]
GLGAYSTNHSLSYKAMRLMIPILIIERKNQMQIAHENNWGSQVRFNNTNSKYINLSNKLDKLVGTPTVKRSIRQTINLINAIIKKYSKNFKVNNIVIEMAREHNNKDVKDNQRQLQKFIKNQKDLIENEFNIDLDKSGKNKNTNFLLKLWLWKQQEGRDAYDGEFIDKNDLLHNHWSKYEIDHIIPYSISFDDSRKNKVLTKSINNQNKGNRTPYSWSPNIIQKMESQWKKWYYPISTTKKTSDSLKSIDKYYYLISKHNYSDPSNQKDFIARNLVDTRYTTKFVLFLFKDFIDNVNNEHILFEAKIKTINGKMTNFFRKMINRIKDHDK